jgi:hypothetical protein
MLGADTFRKSTRFSSFWGWQNVYGEHFHSLTGRASHFRSINQDKAFSPFAALFALYNPWRAIKNVAIVMNASSYLPLSILSKRFFSSAYLYFLNIRLKLEMFN